MIDISLNRQLRRPDGRANVVAWMLLLIMFAPISQAEDGAPSTDAMLENLKQRSAEERWERLKKQYPANPAVPRRATPAQLPADEQAAQANGEVPPAPSQALLIPRMAGVPQDTSNDWIITARQPEFQEDDLAAEFDEDSKNTSVDSPTRIASQDTQVTPAPVPAPAVQESDGPTPPRALHERRISEISPYYDRDRDGDIRKFAIEKGRELDIEFKPKAYSPRSFPEIVLAWEASNYYFHPLYFADPALERYGHSHHPLIQPVASIARAGFQFVFLPYQMTINPICKQESMLGYYRPGDVTPKLHYQPPLNATAAAVETGFVTGLYFMIVP